MHVWEIYYYLISKTFCELDGIFNYFLFKTPLTMALCTKCLLTRVLRKHPVCKRQLEKASLHSIPSSAATAAMTRKLCLVLHKCKRHQTTKQGKNPSDRFKFIFAFAKNPYSSHLIKSFMPSSTNCFPPILILAHL